MQIDWSSEGGNGGRLTRSSLTPRINSRILVPSVQGHPSPKERKYDTTPAVPTSIARPPKLARGVRHAVPKHKVRTGCKSGAESLHSVHLLRANIRDVIAKSAKTSSSSGSPTSGSESTGCCRTVLPIASATGFAVQYTPSSNDKSKALRTFCHCRFPPANATPNPSAESWDGCPSCDSIDGRDAQPCCE